MVFTLVLALGELLSAEARAATSASWHVGGARPAGQLQAPAPAEPFEQLHNPRTGVTCTMRILKAEPVDKAAVLPSPERGVDPGIRGRVSPCLD